jgi:CheY-like chemotaxis protein
MKSILYVEDEQFFGSIVSQKLGEKGFKVVLASTGEKGLELSQNEEFSLILLDIFLPGINGFEVLEKLKNNPKTKDIPVIMLTNLDTKEDREKSKKLGAESFLVKMLTDPKDIFNSVEEVFAKKATPINNL